MNKPELLYGERDAGDFGMPRSEIHLADAAPTTLQDVEIFYSLFEVPMSAALEQVPRALHPSIPAVMAINFWRANESPFGRFEFAYVGVACRTGIKPRHLVIDGWCDNQAAANYFAANYGFEFNDATVQMRETYAGVSGQVTVDGECFLDVRTSRCVALGGSGAMVKYSPPLNYARVAGDNVLAQFEAGFTFKRVLRGELELPVFQPEAIGDLPIAPNYAIAGTYAVCDVQLLPLRFVVDLEQPAEAGGAKKIA